MTVPKHRIRMVVNRALRDARALAQLIEVCQLSTPDLNLAADVDQIVERLRILASDLERVVPESGNDLDNIEMTVSLRSVPIGEQEDDDLNFQAFIQTQENGLVENGEHYYRAESVRFTIGADETGVELPRDTEQLIEFGKQLVWMAFKDMLDQIPATAPAEPEEVDFDLVIDRIPAKRKGDQSYRIMLTPDLIKAFDMDPQAQSMEVTFGPDDMMLYVPNVQPGLGRVLNVGVADSSSPEFIRYQQTKDVRKAVLDLLRTFQRMKGSAMSGSKKPTKH